MFTHVSSEPVSSYSSTDIYPVITVAPLHLCSAKCKLKGEALPKDYNYDNALDDQAYHMPLGWW
jgi:hypothetical protein